MASYTAVSQEALERFLIMFEIGELERFEPISDGIENSNYFVFFKDLEQEYVLTITEGLEFDEVPFFNDLLHNLSSSGLRVPAPQRTLDGMPSTIFKGKPTWLFNRLAGAHINTPTATQCFEVGAALSSIHNISKKCRYTRGNAYSSEWAAQSLSKVEQELTPTEKRLLEETLGRYEKLGVDERDLPKGIVHGDLFRDNALFEGDTLTGVIDFYHACEDFLILDIAVTVNDWCLNDVEVDDAKLTALLEGYETNRVLEKIERDALDEFRQYAAMRFAITRLLAGRSDSHTKNPKEFLSLLQHLSD